MTLTLMVLFGVVAFFLVRKMSKVSSTGKALRTTKKSYAGGDKTSAIVDSIEAYLVQTHGMTAQPAEDDQLSCYRDLNSNVQLFVTWHKAPYLMGKDLPRDSRTVKANTDAVVMRVCLLGTNGGSWQRELKWGAVDRSSWNGRPKGLYAKPIDRAIREALAVIKK